MRSAQSGPHRRVPTGRYIWGPATAALWSTPKRTLWSTVGLLLELAVFVLLILMDRTWLILPLAVVIGAALWLLGREFAMRDALRSELEDSVRGTEDLL